MEQPFCTPLYPLSKHLSPKLSRTTHFLHPEHKNPFAWTCLCPAPLRRNRANTPYGQKAAQKGTDNNLNKSKNRQTNFWLHSEWISDAQIFQHLKLYYENLGTFLIIPSQILPLVLSKMFAFLASSTATAPHHLLASKPGCFHLVLPLREMLVNSEDRDPPSSGITVFTCRICVWSAPLQVP